MEERTARWTSSCSSRRRRNLHPPPTLTAGGGAEMGLLRCTVTTRGLCLETRCVRGGTSSSNMSLCGRETYAKSMQVGVCCPGRHGCPDAAAVVGKNVGWAHMVFSRCSGTPSSAECMTLSKAVVGAWWSDGTCEFMSPMNRTASREPIFCNSVLRRTLQRSPMSMRRAWALLRSSE